MSRPIDPPHVARQPITLSAADVHVWIVDPADVCDDDHVARCRAVLNDDEQARMGRFRLERLRHPFLVTRALVRDVLSRYAQVAPHEWRFSDNRYGRPEIHPELDCGSLRFNISHTDGLIVCAISQDRELGVDVENVERRWSGVGLARRYFAAQEVADLLARPAEEHRETFFAYWTLKEAYIKARGMGLALPLDQFGFRLASDGPPTIEIDPRLGDNPKTWQFFQHRPSPRHRLALAVRSSSDEVLTVRVAPFVPLAT